MPAAFILGREGIAVEIQGNHVPSCTYTYTWRDDGESFVRPYDDPGLMDKLGLCATDFTHVAVNCCQRPRHTALLDYPDWHVAAAWRRASVSTAMYCALERSRATSAIRDAAPPSSLWHLSWMSTGLASAVQRSAATGYSLRRLGKAQDAANAVAFLASEAAN